MAQPEAVFKFQIDFDSKKVIVEPIGRLYLSNGSCVRLYFTPKGFQMCVSKSALEDGTIFVNDDDIVEFAGLGALPKQGWYYELGAASRTTLFSPFSVGQCLAAPPLFELMVYGGTGDDMSPWAVQLW